MKSRFLRNNKGQVAIFIALLFQVLFLFFAMIINVGLLVHHKINLQNSVDLAAYYGAMKQAEVLNAIGHVNYQIRQSWKLLTWRHRVLGSAGGESTNGTLNTPLDKIRTNANTLADVEAGLNTPISPTYRLPRFCIAYDPHELQNNQTSSENSCRSLHEATQVQLPNPNVLFIPGFFGFGSVVGAAITRSIEQIRARCSYVGTLNYIYGGKFILAHNNDVEQRAHLINYLATGLSTDENNFFEIDGGSARQGIEKTLSKNLTDANRASLNFRVLNGLALGSCRKTNSRIGSEQLQNDAPPWLVPVEVYPVWRYYDCDPQGGNGAEAVNQQARHLSADPQNRPSSFASAPPELQNIYNEMNPFLGPRPVLTGYEKDPWCMAYVGVKAETSPRIPFMPLSNVTLTAEAYSKPFGGRVGPWYTNRWDPGQQGENRITGTANNPLMPGRTERNGGVRVLNIQGVTNIDDPSWAANISRFPGDQLGWMSERVLGYFHRLIRINSADNNQSSYARAFDGTTLPFPMANDLRPSLRHYESIGSAESFSRDGSRDQLTWDNTTNAAPKLRLAEIAAIAPDLFDMSYYSIDPDFYNNYFVKIQRHINVRPGFNTENSLLGDLGSRFRSTPEAERFNVFDQIRIQRMAGIPEALNSEVAMPYVTKNPAHLLNSWSIDSIMNFSQNTNLFGSCVTPRSVPPRSPYAETDYDRPLQPATPGNCIQGGRVGYSVKLVARDHLLDSTLELGGAGVSGSIRNLPPEDW